MKPVVSSHTQLFSLLHLAGPLPTPRTPQPSAMIPSPEDTPAKGSLGPQEEGGGEGKMSAVPGAAPLER